MANPVSDLLNNMRQRGSDVGSSGTFGKLLKIGIVLFVLVFLLPSMFTYVEPGHVGILIHRAGGGVDPDPLGPGLHFRNPLLSAIEEYPVFMQTLVLTRETTEGSPSNDEINVNSKEGQPLSLDVAMSFEIDPMKVPAMYQTFRTDIGMIQHGYVKQTIRQALQEVVGDEAIADIMGPKKAETVSRAQALLQERLLQVRDHGEAVHPERVPGAAVGHRGDQCQERDAATGPEPRRTSCRRTSSRRAATRSRRRGAPRRSPPRRRRRRVPITCCRKASRRRWCSMARQKWNGAMPQVSGGGMPMIQLPSIKQ